VTGLKEGGRRREKEKEKRKIIKVLKIKRNKKILRVLPNVFLF